MPAPPLSASTHAIRRTDLGAAGRQLRVRRRGAVGSSPQPRGRLRVRGYRHHEPCFACPPMRPVHCAAVGWAGGSLVGQWTVRPAYAGLPVKHARSLLLRQTDRQTTWFHSTLMEGRTSGQSGFADPGQPDRKAAQKQTDSRRRSSDKAAAAASFQGSLWGVRALPQITFLDLAPAPELPVGLPNRCCLSVYLSVSQHACLTCSPGSCWTSDPDPTSEPMLSVHLSVRLFTACPSHSMPASPAPQAAAG
jgi:hypothetical protein